MDLSLFSSLLRNLLHTNVMYTCQNQQALPGFEEKYCFHPSLQPMFTAQALTFLMESMQENTFYEIIDTLQVCLLFFRFADQTFFVGPYTKKEFEERKMQILLAENQIPASYCLSLKLYYSAFPLLGTFHIQNTITACINAFSSASCEFSYRLLHGFQEELDTRDMFDAASIDYSELYRRYDAENHFLKMIETGNTENIMTSYYELSIPAHPTQQRFQSATYQNPVVSLSITRALARKAAERGGASVIEIDEITQRAVQKMASSQSLSEQINYTSTMLCELTEAVRRHQTQFGSYTPPIRKVLEYLHLHYSQEISLTYLADMVHTSPSHLSKTFRQETGITITGHIAKLRCGKAAQLLSDTALSVSEISSYVGYPDSNYFVKVFRKQYGMTPTAFRTSCLSKI